MKEKNITKIAILTGNDGFGVAGKKQLEDAAKAAGLEIVANEVYDKQATDLTDILTKVKGAAGVQAVVNWSIVPAQSIVAKNMRQLGLNVPLYQSHGFGNRKYIELAGAAAEGILFPASRLLVANELPDSHPQKAVLTTYIQDYETKFKEDASAFGGYAYDALLIVAEGAKKAKSADRAKVRTAIENLQGIVGVTGTFNFTAADHGGLGMDAFEMMTVKGGKFTIYKP
jgi:branched-chain amino acid transport system substrate-binding protein